MILHFFKYLTNKKIVRGPFYNHVYTNSTKTGNIIFRNLDSRERLLGFKFKL